ncbi:predicted protein [Nematostella vectensis]|uniref:Laminin EGF-like domain-containing protein n=1 Tax=Nematostella vectensis TaxID=45351 RepID=A7SNE3_NEMVE|nr:multiple epidermal growth factor-like domains protein 10 [Nematostella vectensis]EDO34785.1 predicted protein [Nematostella vectensis]|eukprot:XP_001626885.1 predicted protein [Nematostella vectensis]
MSEELRAFVALIVVFVIVTNSFAKQSECNNTNKGKYCKCTQCSKTGSTGVCTYPNPVDASSVRCVCKTGYIGSLCDECANGYYRSGNTTGQYIICLMCNCSGNLDLTKPNSCDAVTGKCYKCLPNVTGEHCEKCLFPSNCTRPTDNSHSGTLAAKHYKLRDTTIIVVCAILAFICIIAIAALIYRHHKRQKFKGRLPKLLWTAEISNRNFDDLDFSLLDPVSDTPFVYRNDTSEFEEALMGEEKAQLQMDTHEDEDTLLENYHPAEL